MVAIAIISLLAAIATPFYLSYLDKARVTVAISDLKAIEAAVFDYYSTKGQFPDSLAQINLKNLTDPWGTPYKYLRIDGGEKGNGKKRKDHYMVPVNDDFDIYSIGKDFKTASSFASGPAQDDIVRAFNGSYFGMVSNI